MTKITVGIAYLPDGMEIADWEFDTLEAANAKFDELTKDKSARVVEMYRGNPADLEILNYWHVSMRSDNTTGINELD